MRNKDKVILDKKLPYEYKICLYILEELCDEVVIDIFEMSDAIILLRKKYKIPIIVIYEKTIIPVTKKLGKVLIKEASPEHKLRVCAYVRVSTDSEDQLESFNAQIGRYKRIIQEEHADTWEFAGIFADTESGASIDKKKDSGICWINVEKDL